MLLPGPEAQQLATYIGWLMHGRLGGLVAGGLFIIPGIVSIMALSYVYALWGNVPIVSALFFGLKAAVLVIVVEAVLRIGKESTQNAHAYEHRCHLLHRNILSGSSLSGHTGMPSSVIGSFNPMIRALSENGIEVTAIHSHMLDEQPRLFFIHFWANDDAAKLANGLQAALAKIAVSRN